ncbi:MAG: hypothetical protein ACRDPR_07750, partial [Nocardioidaceae bacterium]
MAATGSLLCAAVATGASADSLTMEADATKAPGDAGTFVVGLVAESVPGDLNNCNANGGNPVIVHFASSDPAVVPAPADIALVGCDDPVVPGVQFGETVSYAVASTALDGQAATITASAADTGRSTGNPKIYGTFSPDSITITVATPPTDTTTPVITPH